MLSEYSYGTTESTSAINHGRIKMDPDFYHLLVTEGHYICLCSSGLAEHLANLSPSMCRCLRVYHLEWASSSSGFMESSLRIRLVVKIMRSLYRFEKEVRSKSEQTQESLSKPLFAQPHSLAHFR